jgi:hypothetical protein
MRHTTTHTVIERRPALDGEGVGWIVMGVVMLVMLIGSAVASIATWLGLFLTTLVYVVGGVASLGIVTWGAVQWRRASPPGAALPSRRAVRGRDYLVEIDAPDPEPVPLVRQKAIARPVAPLIEQSQRRAIARKVNR